jgi:hypothetical protein
MWGNNKISIVMISQSLIPYHDLTHIFILFFRWFGCPAFFTQADKLQAVADNAGFIYVF